MKKTIIALSLIIVTGLTVNAQQAAFGIKGGLNVSDLSGDNSSAFSSKVSFHVGGLAHIHLSRYFALQPEVVYSEQGAKISDGTDIKYNVNYINIPVLLQYMVDHGLRIETGPQLGLLTSAKAKSGGTSTDIKSSLNSADFSWALGLGYITLAKVGFDARYNFGISDISKSSSTTTHNNVFQLGAFYQF